MYAALIVNKTYDFQSTGYNHLPEVEADKQNVLDTFKFLGIKDDHIFKLYDSNYDDVDELWDKVKVIFRNAQKTRTNILFIPWYGGHGEMYDGSTSTQILINDPDPTKRRYPWEKNLAIISRFSHTYTLAYFDCCRVQVKSKENVKGQGEIDAEPKTGNLKIIFAC